MSVPGDFTLSLSMRTRLKNRLAQIPSRRVHLQAPSPTMPKTNLDDRKLVQVSASKYIWLYKFDFALNLSLVQFGKP